MSKSFILAAALVAMGAAAASAQTSRWRHTTEVETFDRGIFGQQSVVTRLGYDNDGRVAYRVEDNLGYVVDSLVYRYDALGNVTYRADYRGPSADDLTFYTYDDWAYDPVIPGLAVWHVGHQYVDEEWSVYAADKLIVARDADGHITRVGDYTPGDPEAGIPDIPLTYVKTFTNADRRLTAYKKESYVYDPVTEEAYLRLDEEWTAIEWAEYAGQALDLNACFSGQNRIARAHVYDDYYGYAYDLAVTYTPALTPGAYDYEAVQDAADAGQRKVHTLRFTDANGSFEETFSTYRLADGGDYTLSFVERVTEAYDDHHNLTLQERALTDRMDDPAHLSVRQGKRWTYTYDARYDDWTTRRELLFTQSYEDGVDGTYEPVATILRQDWVELPAPDVDALRPVSASATEGAISPAAWSLDGRRLPAAAPGLRIEGGRKVVR